LATTKTASDDLQVQVLDTIRKGQEAVVDGLRSWTEAAEQFHTAYDFAAELLKAQRDFLHKAIQVTTPLYERIEEEGTKAVKTPRS
jgi:hypothetical protein